MDISGMRVLLQGVAKIFEAGLKSKTWDIHGLPQFITTTHHKGSVMIHTFPSLYSLYYFTILTISPIALALFLCLASPGHCA